MLPCCCKTLLCLLYRLYFYNFGDGRLSLTGVKLESGRLQRRQRPAFYNDLIDGSIVTAPAISCPFLINSGTGDARSTFLG